MKKIFVIIILGLLVVNSTNAQNPYVTINGMYYILDNTNKKATVTFKGAYYDTYFSEYSGDVVIPTSVVNSNVTYAVTAIKAGAFRICSSLKSITIPNSITSIGENAFWGCDGLKAVYNYATTPQSITQEVFFGGLPPRTDSETCVLYVPCGCRAAYKAATGWKNFKNIVEMDCPTYTITWKNWDGTTLATTSVLKGATPSYTGATPTRPSTAQYTYTFSGWTPSITAATANKTYTATYTATPRYTITFNANGGLIPTNGNMGNTPSGHITTLSADRTSGTVVVTKDKTHFQTMTNDCPSREGYTFAGWYTDPTSGVQVYDNTGYRVVGSYWNSEGKWIGTSNVTLYAHWTPIPYTITVNSSNVSQGSASGGGTYDYGTNHQITATPNECYRFVQWSDGNTNNPRTITVTGDATYTAEFEQIQYTIEALPDNPAQGSATVTNP